MNKSNKPSWDDAPLEARILVQSETGNFNFGSFDHAYILDDEGWYGTGEGRWFTTISGFSNPNWRNTIEYRPTVKQSLTVDTNINHVTEGMQEKDPLGLSAHSAGAKLDAGKVRPDLILSGMPRALLAVAEIGTFGANKYSEDGWLSVPNGIKRYTAAMDRHRLKESIEPTDPDSELAHAAHLAWNALARLELMLRDK